MQRLIGLIPLYTIWISLITFGLIIPEASAAFMGVKLADCNFYLSAQQTDPDLIPDQILNDLDSDILTVRVDAVEYLLNSREISYLDIIETIKVKQANLSYEQFDRLTFAAEKLYLGQLAVIGIQMQTGEIPIRIEHIFPEAPAARVLRIGDQVLSINDEILPDDSPSTVLQRNITSREVGDKITMSIVRDGKRMNVVVELANAFKLEGFSSSQLERDRKKQWLDLYGDMFPAPIELDVIKRDLDLIRAEPVKQQDKSNSRKLPIDNSGSKQPPDNDR